MNKIRVTLKLDLTINDKTSDDDIVTYIRSHLPDAFGKILTNNPNPVEIVDIKRENKMTNELDMIKDIYKLKSHQQRYDLNELFYCRYVKYNSKKLEQLKKSYIKKYKFLANYI